MSSSVRTTGLRAVALAATVSVLATSCSLLPGQGGDDAGPNDEVTVTAVESGLDVAGKPVRGGQLIYGLEAEVGTTGYCLPEAELAISGMQVARSLYDTLTVPDENGDYVPYLAKAVDHDDSYKEWTISLRPGVTFHDGSSLDADVVKNNLDAYRGQYEGRSPLLFTFVLDNIAEVEAVNELTVRVTTKVPWVAFPAVLYASGRLGMMAQKQLDASKTDCATKPIGTGPFSFVSWKRDQALKVRRYPKYWQDAPDGKPYPYLNAIEFRPVQNSDSRIAQLQQGELNMMHTSTSSDMAESLPALRDSGAINLLVSTEKAEVAYVMMNSSVAPLDDRDTRLAIAHAIDRDALNEKSNKGFPDVASGPFAPTVLGHLDDPGFPTYDLAAAKKQVAAMKKAKKDTSLGLLTSAGPVAVRQAQIEKEMLQAAGFQVTLEIETEADLIKRVIGGDYELAAFRNQPGEDPDMDYIWWYGENNPVNFGRFDDPVINKNLEIGRTDPDRTTRRKAYEAINEQFAKQVWNVWLWHSPWAVAEAANVHGILGPDLPGDQGPPSARLVTGHSLLGVWIAPA
ncbi:MAG: ABC-type dipeptide transport system, periplasmic component [Ilumatobacteraceae bacterium]|nr:ABC-type dipeptide transport system, periplasmic component [Ilumatobacteraceae bacterium]